MNPFIAMVVDVSGFIVLFVPALLFPENQWLGLAPMLLTFTEAVIHTVMGFVQHHRNPKLPIYTPGQATAVLFLMPLGVSYTVIVASQGLVTGIDWLWAVLYFVGSLLVTLIIPEQALKSMTARWPFERRHFLSHYYKHFMTLDDALTPAEGV